MRNNSIELGQNVLKIMKTVVVHPGLGTWTENNRISELEALILQHEKLNGGEGNRKLNLYVFIFIMITGWLVLSQ